MCQFRFKQHSAFLEAIDVAEKVDTEFSEKFGRKHGLFETYRCDDAELILVTAGSTVSTARETIDNMRDNGEKVGLLKLKMFRPFPTELFRKILGGVPKVAVFDRNISPGCGGMFCQEIRSAIYDLPDNKRPKLFSFIGGLGGRDIKVETFAGIIETAMKEDKPSKDIYWVDLKE